MYVYFSVVGSRVVITALLDSDCPSLLFVLGNENSAFYEKAN